jgi:hypothetical protein
MGKQKSKKEIGGCPVGSFFRNLDEIFGAGSDIGEHLKRSQLELLKAIRSWADGRIEQFEKQRVSKLKKKITKIKVE